MATLVRNLLSRSLQVARVANISLTGAANVVPVRTMHWQRVTPVVLAKLEAVSVRTHMSLWNQSYQHAPHAQQCVLPCRSTTTAFDSTRTRSR